MFIIIVGRGKEGATVVLDLRDTDPTTSFMRRLQFAFI
jgi:hypothetical protein